MCYTAAQTSAVLSLHRYRLLTPFPRLFPSPPHICDTRPQTWRPRSHPHSLLSFTLATSLSCAHPLAPLAIGDSPRPASSEQQGESESFAPLRAGARVRSSQQAARESRDSLTERIGLEPRFHLFPAFFCQHGIFEKQERSLPTLWRRKRKLQKWSLGRREALPWDTGLGPGPRISADER